MTIEECLKRLQSNGELIPRVLLSQDTSRLSADKIYTLYL